MVIIRVKDLNDGLRQILLLNSFLVITLDEENLEWDEAWEITTKTCAYTNHTIMAEAADDRKVSHADLSVVNDRHSADLLVVARISLLDLGNEAAVDLLNDLVNTRKKAGEELDWPFLKSFRHDGVVRVGTCLCGDLPGLIPL